jgi:TRAP-type C4-dicarboxylate transport system substrate-binding protein
MVLFFSASLICIILCGCSVVHIQPKLYRPKSALVLRLAESCPPEHPSARASEEFARLVGERSKGRIQIRVYFEGELGSPSEVLEQVKFGGISAARVNSLDLLERVPSLQYYFTPDVYSSASNLMAWINVYDEKIDADCLMERFIPLVFYYPDIRCFYSDELIMTSLDAFTDKKIGTISSTVVQNTVRSLGAEPVTILSANTYSSLRNGFIDAHETAFSEFILSDEYSFPGNVCLSRYLAAPDVLLVGSEIFTKLPVADRTMLLECAQETLGYQKKLMDSFHVFWFAQTRNTHNLSWEFGVVQ